MLLLSEKPQEDVPGVYMTSYFLIARALSVFLALCKRFQVLGHKLPTEGSFLQTVPELESSQHVLLSGGQHHTVSPGPPSQSRGGWGELGDTPVRDLAGLHLLFLHWLHQEFPHAFSAFYSF